VTVLYVLLAEYAVGFVVQAGMSFRYYRPLVRHRGRLDSRHWFQTPLGRPVAASWDGLLWPYSYFLILKDGL
jgi:hypothetical protein